MKAIIQERYGAPEDVLSLREIETPEAGEGEVLVRVRASAVAGDDWHLVRGLPYVACLSTGLRRPKNRVPGRNVAGVVEATGDGVTEFSPGDEVYGWCDGAFAEYAPVPASSLAPKPAGLSFEEAGVVPESGFTALQAVRDEGRIAAGQRVLVLGASGGVGTFAVQIAAASGASVTGVCSAGNADLVRSLGADRVIDYAREDFADGDPGYDLIVDLAGNRSLADCRRALTPEGTLVLVGSSGRATPAGALPCGLNRWFMGVNVWIAAMVTSWFTRQRLRPLIHADRKEDLFALTELIEAGKVRPVVSASYSLAEVAAAIGHFEAGHARGKVSIAV